MRRMWLGLGLLLAACGSGSSGDAATTTRADATTTTAVFETTTTTSTSTPPAPDCAAPAEPAASVARAEAAGDVDGDGLADTIVTYGAGTDADPGPWHIRVELGSGGGSDAELAGARSFAPVRALGGADVSGDAATEAFVVVDSGASVALVGIFQWQGCELARLGEPFAVGGTVTHLDGLACGDGSVDALSATSDDGETYTAHRQTFVVDNGTLTAQGSAAESMLQATDPALGDYATISCPGVESP